MADAEPEPARPSRLVGEKDVLAAIACEFLDEGAPRRDTAPAVCAGRVLMTTFRFQFEPHERDLARARRHLLGREDAEVASFFLVPLGCVAAVKRKGAVVELQTKDLRQLSFRFDPDEITKIFTVLTTYVFPDKIDYLFAFYHRLSEGVVEEQPLLPCTLDWDVYDAQAEWEREGVFENGKWRVSLCNEGFRAIETYPDLLVVPSSIDDEVLLDAMNFRSLGRIPCLCWFNKANGAVICRSSQPKVGMSKATSPADESLVAAISASSLLRDFLHIIDSRPKSNAMANRAKGYGVESSVNYTTCSISFMNVPNIHSMRDSIKKLRTLCSSSTCDNLQWLGNIEDTKWLVYVRQLLKASLHVATLIRNGESVLVHCSHGWDRTTQISALAQLFLDPYFRTWKGFQVLVEKEWLSYGHPFQLRHSHGEKADTQESPIFIQFLDCVYQLVNIYPSYFEFNEGLLLTLADALHSCRFGTFLFDCKKHRREVNLDERTPSVWTWINGFKEQLTEPTFIPGRALNPPLTGLLKRVGLWSAMFLRWSGQPLVEDGFNTTSVFPQNEDRCLTWQLPQGTIMALNASHSARFQEAQLIRDLQARVALLEQQLSNQTTTKGGGTDQ